jgi:hypothetical protein
MQIGYSRADFQRGKVSEMLVPDKYLIYSKLILPCYY